MNLYFVRHGESEANTQHIISNRGSAFHLTSRGRDQTKELAENLRAVSFNAMFCSPVLRARETAEILSASFSLPYQVTDALREYDCGELEECSDDESWKRHRYYFNEWMLRRNYDQKPAGGESFLNIRDRFLPFIESLKIRNDGNILLVSHGGLLLLMLPVILGNIQNEFARQHGIGHTDCIIAGLHTGGFDCKQWGNMKF